MPPVMTQDQNTNAMNGFAVEEVVGKSRNIGPPQDRGNQMKEFRVLEGFIHDF